MFNYILLAILLIAWIFMPRDTIKSIARIKEQVEDTNKNKKRALYGSYLSLVAIIGFLSTFTIYHLIEMNVLPVTIITNTTLSTCLAFFFLLFLLAKHGVIPKDIRDQLNQQKISDSSSR